MTVRLHLGCIPASSGRSGGPAVPKTSAVTKTERTFGVRDQNGRAEWTEVRKGDAVGNLVEVLGDLKAGDLIVTRRNRRNTTGIRRS